MAAQVDGVWPPAVEAQGGRAGPAAHARRRQSRAMFAAGARFLADDQTPLSKLVGGRLLRYTRTPR